MVDRTFVKVVLEQDEMIDLFLQELRRFDIEFILCQNPFYESDY